MAISPIILCGGEGSRLWPVSRRDFPKQFARLVGELSCFQQAVIRLHGAEGARRPVVVAGEAHEVIVRAQLESIGIDAVVILEPEGRDSAPATAAAAAYLLGAGEDAAAIVQPADHYIPDVERFRAAAALAAQGAERGHIVTFGIHPSLPETSYGYISAGDAVPACPGVSKVRRFVEKPSRERAIEYLAKGFLWNSGMFAFRPSSMMEEMCAFEPAIAEAVEQAVTTATRDGNVVRLDPAAFGRAPRKSLDYAVMERTARAAVIVGDFSWSDLGAWNAIYDNQNKDERGNVISGPNVVALQSERCFIRASNIPLAAVGLSDIGVIAEPDGIAICRLENSGSIKNAVDKLRAIARPEALRSTKDPYRNRDYRDLESAAGRLGSWLDNSALPLWWSAGADHEFGGFFEALDRDGRAVRGVRRMRVQARQSHVYALAGLAGWQGPWRTAVAHGLSFLRERYRRSDGLYRTSIDGKGAPLDDRPFLYDQAFVLLALASAAKAGVDARRCEAEALELRLNVEDRFSRPGGGFFEQEFRGSRLHSNPNMHLLEAALLWCEGSRGEKWKPFAGQIVRLALDCFIDPGSGILREYFDDDGAPAPGRPGRIFEPGHQFEWAWLLSNWDRRYDDRAAGSAARRLFEIGERNGIDSVRGVAIDALLTDMSPHSPQARLWPQTERLKAALALAAVSTDAEERVSFEGSALAATEGLSHYLHRHIPGLWHDKMRSNGTLAIGPAPASSLYHIAGAIGRLRNYAN